MFGTGKDKALQTAVALLEPGQQQGPGLGELPHK
jgi:hypothetical protein